MASEIRVNTINARSGIGTISINDGGINVSGIVTARGFSGDGSLLTNLPSSMPNIGIRQIVTTEVGTLNGNGYEFTFNVLNATSRVFIMFQATNTAVDDSYTTYELLRLPSSSLHRMQIGASGDNDNFVSAPIILCAIDTPGSIGNKTYRVQWSSSNNLSPPITSLSIKWIAMEILI